LERQTLTSWDFERLKALGKSQAHLSGFHRAWVEWKRPSASWGERLHWFRLAVGDELRRWQRTLPALLSGGFAFTLGLWVAVFAVAASTVSTPGVPLQLRYAAGLTAVGYLYLYAELARARRSILPRDFALAVADGAVAVTLYLMSAPYLNYGQLLLFFAAARFASRFPGIMALPVGALLLVPYIWLHQGPLMEVVLVAFGTLGLMLGIQLLLGATLEARRQAGLQLAVATLTSSLVRAADKESLFADLANLAPPLASYCAWAFWVRDPVTDEFRCERWYGLPATDRPVTAFTPTLGQDPTEGVMIEGPLPGTSFGEATLIQPMTGDGEIQGLLTLSGQKQDLEGEIRLLARSVADEAGLTLARLRALDDQRSRTEAMELANRLAGAAAPVAYDQPRALDALLGPVSEVLRCDSLHLEWLDGDQIEIIVGSADPLCNYASQSLALAGTRACDAVSSGRPVREAVTGRRPEDIFIAPAGLRHVGVAPLRCAGVQGTLQAGRREARPFANSELLILQLLAERLGLVFEAGIAVAAPGPTTRMSQMQAAGA
jgi:hypothetical protein